MVSARAVRSTYYSLPLYCRLTPTGVCSCRPIDVVRRIRSISWRCGSSSSALVGGARGFIEHDSDPARWRHPEIAEVRRRHPQGVPLCSTAVREEEMRAQQEELMAQRGEDMHWKVVHVFAVGITLFLMLLQVLPDYVEPVPSPEYVPYVKPVENISGSSLEGSTGLCTSA